jgi:hypothetical protein
MMLDHHRAETARKILKDREARYALFPSEIFDEYAWTMLLHLFVAFAGGEVLSEYQLVNRVRTTTRIGQRWLYQLAKDGQVKLRYSGDDVVLTADAETRLRRYLDAAEAA